MAITVRIASTPIRTWDVWMRSKNVSTVLSRHPRDNCCLTTALILFDRYVRKSNDDSWTATDSQKQQQVSLA